MKMHASVILSLLTMPLLVTCDNDRATSMMQDALAASRHLGSFSPFSMTTHGFFDGTTNNVEEDKKDHDPAAPMFQARALRDLQFTDACNDTYNALWEDQALNDAADTYSTNYDEATSSLANCVDSSTNSVKCSVDGPIEGETEYETACTNAGGETMPIDFDLNCEGTFEGETSSVEVDLPPILTCIPASNDFDSCAEDLRDLYKNVTDLMASLYEFGLSSGGFSQVSCDAGDVGAGSGSGGSNGGSSNAVTRGIEISSVAMFGISLIMFGYY